MSLGAKLQKLRKSRQLSQEEFADIMKVSRQSVSKWELDQCYPEINKLIEIADYFNITLDELIRDNSDGNDSMAEEVENKSTASVREMEGVYISNLNRNQKKLILILQFVLLLAFYFYGAITGNYYVFIGYVSAIVASYAVRFIKRSMHN